MDSGTIAGTHHHFGLTILIPVVGYDVLLVVLEVAHIRTAVNPPQTGAIHLQALHDAIFLGGGATNNGTILGVGLLYLALVVELHQYLQFTIAIYIGTAGIVGHKFALNILVFQLNLFVACCPRRCLLAQCLLLTSNYGGNLIGAIDGAARIGEVAHLQILGHSFTVAIHIVRNIVVFIGLKAPTEINAAANLHAHQSAIKLVGKTLRRGCANGKQSYEESN